VLLKNALHLFYVIESDLKSSVDGHFYWFLARLSGWSLCLASTLDTLRVRGLFWYLVIHALNPILDPLLLWRLFWAGLTVSIDSIDNLLAIIGQFVSKDLVQLIHHHGVLGFILLQKRPLLPFGIQIKQYFVCVLVSQILFDLVYSHEWLFYRLKLFDFLEIDACLVLKEQGFSSEVENDVESGRWHYLWLMGHQLVLHHHVLAHMRLGYRPSAQKTNQLTSFLPFLRSLKIIYGHYFLFNMLFQFKNQLLLRGFNCLWLRLIWFRVFIFDKFRFDYGIDILAVHFIVGRYFLIRNWAYHWAAGATLEGFFVGIFNLKVFVVKIQFLFDVRNMFFIA
jgi:hypothetical protein